MLPSSRGGAPGRELVEVASQAVFLALPHAFALSLPLAPCQLHSNALPQVTVMLSVPRDLLPAPWLLAPQGAQRLHRNLAALSLRAEALAPGPALCPPRKAARGSGAPTRAAVFPSGH